MLFVSLYLSAPKINRRLSPFGEKTGSGRKNLVVARCCNQSRATEEEDEEEGGRMLYIVGLGLGDERDIILRGLEAILKCQRIYIEAYTSLISIRISSGSLLKLEKMYGKTVTVADREMVEQKADGILSQAS